MSMMNCQVGDYELWSLSFLYEWISSEIQHFTGPGLFGIPYTSTHMRKCTKNLIYTASARIFFCQVRRLIRSFVQLLSSVPQFHQIFILSTTDLSTWLLLDYLHLAKLLSDYSYPLDFSRLLIIYLLELCRSFTVPSV